MDNNAMTLITVEDVCEALMVGKNSVYRLLAEGELKGFRVGRIWKIPRESLNAYIRERSGLA